MKQDQKKILGAIKILQDFFRETKELERVNELEKWKDFVSEKKNLSLPLSDNHIQGSSSVQEDKMKLPMEVAAYPPLDFEFVYALFCDGACRGNPGPGSYAAIGQNRKGEMIFQEMGGSAHTTNNKMELTGAIKALEELESYFLIQKIDWKEIQPVIFIYSDSKYVVDGFHQWLPNWKRRGWKKADGSIPENGDLWKRLDELSLVFRKVSFRWVKGHNGHPQNERCDFLCNEVLDNNVFC
jgi:ribonuclease HI